MANLKLHIAILWLAVFAAHAQQSKLAAEKNIAATTREFAYLHVSSTTFVTGETMYYKLYCVGSGGKKSDVSKIAYVELYSAEKTTPLFHHKLFLKSGNEAGDFLILPTLATGNYKLIGYTNQMQRVDGSYGAVDVLIINPFLANPEKNEGSNTTPTGTAALFNTESQNALLVPEKAEFDKREQIHLKSLKNASGDFSISVKKVGDLPNSALPDAAAFSNVIVQKPNAKFITEARGEIVTGKISAKNATPVASRIVSLSIVGDKPVFKISKTNDVGEFSFSIDREYASNEVVVQVLGDDRAPFAIQLDINRDPIAVAVQPAYSLSNDYAETIKSRSLAAQIENAYYAKKQDSVIVGVNNLPFYHPLAKHYKLDDYTRFPTFSETVTEIVKEAYFSLDNGVYSVRVRDYDLLHEVDVPPLVFVDGLHVQDLKSLFDYKAANIEAIDVASGGYFYQSASFDGILSVTTKNRDFVNFENGDFLKRFEIGLPNLQKRYFQPDYSASSNKRIPDYRHQLLWLPTVNKLTDDISFYTSDVAGSYEIVLQGFTDDGTPVSSSSTFTVR